MKNLTIAFIGGGNIADSIIGGLISSGVPTTNIIAADPDIERQQSISERHGIEVFEKNHDAIKKAEVIVFAVKPEKMPVAIKEIFENTIAKNKIILSVVAGIKIKSIEDWVKESFSIIRIMPNTPALVRSGVTALYANKNTSDKEKAIAEKIMSSVGKTVWLDKEDQMDSVTALSGSGPAYFFYFMELMENHAIEMGLKKEDAHLLTIETALGAAKMALLSNAELKELRLQVTSPAGTTERAINTFVKGKLHKLLRDAMDAAKKRSVELSESFKD